jgi:hypothetical protein
VCGADYSHILKGAHALDYRPNWDQQLSPNRARVRAGANGNLACKIAAWEDFNIRCTVRQPSINLAEGRNLGGANHVYQMNLRLV